MFFACFEATVVSPPLEREVEVRGCNHHLMLLNPTLWSSKGLQGLRLCSGLSENE